ncbi:MAG: ABC transporter permease, partial [Nonomuraea sp.]|nr:ABC transporter permease [Nonomuraea sp.]
MADSVAVKLRNAETPPKRGSHRASIRSRREARAAYLFLAPWFAGLLVITIGPI